MDVTLEFTSRTPECVLPHIAITIWLKSESIWNFGFIIKMQWRETALEKNLKQFLDLSQAFTPGLHSTGVISINVSDEKNQEDFIVSGQFDKVIWHLCPELEFPLLFGDKVIPKSLYAQTKHGPSMYNRTCGSSQRQKGCEDGNKISKAIYFKLLLNFIIIKTFISW